MKKATLLCLVFSMACSKEPPPQMPEKDAMPPAAPSLAASAAAPALAPSLEAVTAGPMPSWTLHFKGFPVVSDDGQRVMYVINGADGMRGYANHKVFIKKVDGDEVEKTLPLFDANELDKADRASKLDDVRKAVDSNVKAARGALAAGRWTSMTAAAGARGKTFTAGDLSIELNALRLSVTNKAGAKLLDFDAKAWKIPDAPADGPSAPICVFEPTLENVHVAPDKKLVAATVVQTEISGGDRCNRSDETHVLVWE